MINDTLRELEEVWRKCNTPQEGWILTTREFAYGLRAVNPELYAEVVKDSRFVVLGEPDAIEKGFW